MNFKGDDKVINFIRIDFKDFFWKKKFCVCVNLI